MQLLIHLGVALKYTYLARLMFMIHQLLMNKYTHQINVHHKVSA